DEGGAEGDLLPDRRVARAGRGVAPPGGAPRPGLRGPLPGRPGRRAPGPVPDRVRGQAPEVGGQGHRRTRRGRGEGGAQEGARGEGGGAETPPRAAPEGARR